MIDLLADFNRRLRWADDDGQALHSEITGFVEANPYTVRIDLDGGEGTATLCRLIDPAAEAEILDRCSRRIGSYLDNGRAALNYLAYALALIDAPSNPQLRPETVEFPIFDNPDIFRKHNRIKQLSAEHRDAIEAVQPYDGQRPGLWLLHELSRVYRHRLVHATKLGTLDEQHSVVVANGTLESTEVLYSGLVEDETPVLRFRIVAQEDDSHVHVNVAVSVCIDDALCRGREAMKVINEIGRDVSGVTSVLSGLVPNYRAGPPELAHWASPPTAPLGPLLGPNPAS